MLKATTTSMLLMILVTSLVGSANAQLHVTGDIDGDNCVDLEDLRIFAEGWLDPNCLISSCEADLYGEDGINMLDFAIMAENWEVKGYILVISEFMAANEDTLMDEDGSSSDWIEIYNPTEQTINLDGWYLTDDVNDLNKWEFPGVEIGPYAHLVVFASGKDRRDPEGELHTNFVLQASGEFLALVFPDGETIAYSYDEYPPQFVDISYGLNNEDIVVYTDTVLVPEVVSAKALIPADDLLGLSWTEPEFNDSNWLSGITGVGYDTETEYDYLINLDVGAMQNVNETVYVRILFTITEMCQCDKLMFYIKRDDGFVTYLNGQIVASALADLENLTWNSGATGNCSDAAAHEFEPYDITEHKVHLQLGDNVLAIHGLNWKTTSSDLLILPKLISSKACDVNSIAEGYYLDATPGAPNQGAMASLGPAIRNVIKNPPQPADDNDLIITAEVSETFDTIQTVRLHYRIMYGSEANVTMLDDGLHGDDNAADGTYGAIIPASAPAPSEMVRWYVTAEDVNNQTSRNPLFPYPDNSPEYYGTVVKDPAVNTQLAVIEWFVENVAASETDSGTRGSVYYDGKFYDNVYIHRRGGSTAGQAKTHFKFNFNRGYKFRFDPDTPRVNEFNLNSTYSDKAYIRQNLAFEAYDWCGCPGSISFPVRAQRNGQFHGVYVFIEEPEEELLEREGIDPDGALYKMYNTFYAGGGAEKKTRRWEGRSDLDNFCNNINNTSGTTLHNNIFDQVNLPLTLNYLVATIITHQNDHPHKNHYLYRDSDGSGEWFFLPWDHDLTWGSNWTGSSYHDYIYAAADQVDGKPTDIKPSHPFVGKQDCQEWNYHWNHLIDALLNDDTVREMYLRRLRTVMDELLKPPATPYDELFIENRIDELVAQMAPDVALDYAKWADPWTWGGQGGYPADQSFEYAINVVKNDYLGVRREHLFVTHNVDNVGSYNIAGSYSALIPNAQPADPCITFDSYVEYNPASHNQDEEYIRLNNNEPYAVDISGYKLNGGVEHTFLSGTVIPSGSCLYMSPNVAAFRARSTSPTSGEGNFVQGNYKGHLSSWGETINLLEPNDALVDSITYTGNPSDQQRYLRITEIMYHPPDPCQGSPYHDEDFEYIELKNIGTTPLSLEDVNFNDGIIYKFSSSITLAGGDYILLVKDPNAFASRYSIPDGVQVVSPYENQLSNGGEKVKLEDSTNSTILEFDYDDDWYSITDGAGFSLTIKDVNNADLDSWDSKSAWRPSAFVGGSPGWDDTGQVLPLGSVKINELLAHSHANEPDWIELYNTTGEIVNIGGWFLSDSQDNYMKYEIPVGTMIYPDPCGYIVFYEDTSFGNPNAVGCHEAFALSENGETLYLHSGQGGELTGYSEQEDFDVSETGVSFGRYLKSTGTYNFVPMDYNTPGLPNAYPKVGPIIINEIMYHPNDIAGDAEYVELLNISGSSVTLQEYDNDEDIYVPWRFTDSGGITFDFPLDITMEDGEYLLLVRDSDVFDDHYPDVPGGVQIFEWVNGRLDNGGEKIQLSKPGDVDEQQERQYIRIDRINYDDELPWPTEPDGNGASLSRLFPQCYGNDPNNWTAATNSPGQPNL